MRKYITIIFLFLFLNISCFAISIGQSQQDDIKTNTEIIKEKNNIIRQLIVKLITKYIKMLDEKKITIDEFFSMIEYIENIIQ